MEQRWFTDGSSVVSYAGPDEHKPEFMRGWQETAQPEFTAPSEPPPNGVSDRLEAIEELLVEKGTVTRGELQARQEQARNERNPRN